MLDFRWVVAVASLDFRIPSASFCKRSTIPFIISAPDSQGYEVLVIEASCANEFLEELVLAGCGKTRVAVSSHYREHGVRRS